MDFSAEFVDTVKATLRLGVEGGYVITVVGEILTGSEAWALANDFVALDDELGSVDMRDHPFAPEQSHDML